MKPDDVAQWAWDVAVFALYGQAPDEWIERQVVIISRCARALSQARSQAYEECAKIAEEYKHKESGFRSVEPDKTVYGWGAARREIAYAIRSKAQ